MLSEEYNNSLKLLKNNYYNNDVPIPGFYGYTATQLGWIKCNGLSVIPHSRNGYGYYVRITKDNTRMSYPVGYLVALAFLGEPRDGDVLVYLNGDCTDYSLSNLKWGTPKEKYNAMFHSKANSYKCVANKSSASKPVEAFLVGDNGIDIQLYYSSITDALNDNDFTKRELYHALKDSNYVCGGFHWRYAKKKYY